MQICDVSGTCDLIHLHDAGAKLGVLIELDDTRPRSRRLPLKLLFYQGGRLHYRLHALDRIPPDGHAVHLSTGEDGCNRCSAANGVGPRGTVKQGKSVCATSDLPSTEHQQEGRVNHGGSRVRVHIYYKK